MTPGIVRAGCCLSAQSVSCLTQEEWHGGAVASAVVLGSVPSVLRLPPGCPVSLW